MSKYDASQALEVLAEAAERVDPDFSGRRQAANELLVALVALDGSVGFRFKQTANDPVVSIWVPPNDTQGSPQASIKYSPQDSAFIISAGGGRFAKHALQYSRITRSYTGDNNSPDEDALSSIIKRVIQLMGI